MNPTSRRRLLKRIDQRINDTACAPELGIVQYMILVAIWALTPRATVNGVIDFVYKQNGDILDVAQVFVTMQAFWKAETPLIHDTGKIATMKGRRPSANFGITPEGKATVKRVQEHLQRVLAFGKHVQDAHKMTPKKVGN